MKEFKGLLRSEIKKAEKMANKVNYSNDCKVTGYSWKIDDFEFGNFITVKCEICHNYEERADKDVFVHIFMDDRRMSFASEY